MIEGWRVCARCNDGTFQANLQSIYKPPYCNKCGDLVDMGENKPEPCNCDQSLELLNTMKKVDTFLFRVATEAKNLKIFNECYKLRKEIKHLVN